MPSFDIKSELDSHEVTNGVDQSNRVIENRFDFKGTSARFDLNEGKVSISSQEEYQLHQMLPILKESFSKRGIDLKCLEPQSIEISTGKASQEIILKEGIDQEIAKKITQMVKSSKLKVQASIQGNSVRISGKNRDDLQQVIKLIKDENFNLPLQFENFRD
tara:strand:- start:4757 stop:5239 length:483 start_codon:yes stop_codon:yes gene_type:complete